jgi:hypothetical protein
LSAYPDRPSANPSSPQPRLYPQHLDSCRPANTSHAVSYSYKLYVAAKKLNSFAIKQIRTVLQKRPGWSVPNESRMSREPRPRATPYGRRRHLPFFTLATRSRHPAVLTTFRMNTCKSVSKQRTLIIFRMNTYAKRGEGGEGHLPNLASIPQFAVHSPARLPCATLAKGNHLDSAEC